MNESNFLGGEFCYKGRREIMWQLEGMGERIFVDLFKVGEIMGRLGGSVG